MNSDLFQNLGYSIQQIIDAIRQVGTSDKVSELSILFSIIVTLNNLLRQKHIFLFYLKYFN